MDPEALTAATLRRAAVVRIYEVRDRLVLLERDAGGQELSGDSAALARAVLDFLAAPRRAAEVRAHVEALAGGPLPRPEVVDELLALLLRAGAIEVARPTPPPRGPGPRVVLGLTGAVASMHAPATVQHLQSRGFEVRVAATDDALRFVRAEALEALTHHPVIDGMWPRDGGALRVPHIELAEWADVVAIAPASATTIARLAAGDYASVVAAIALATRAPVLVAPSMNPAMFESPPVQRNLERLAADGLHVALPGRALEVAERPDARTPVLGGAAPPEVVARMVAELVRTAAPPRPRDAASWDRLYRTTPAPPWQSEVADDDLLAALGPAPSSVLEIGAGLGTLAIAAARRGHRVLATDLSSVALAQAEARAGDAPVIWLQDDITSTRLRGSFQAVVDRACLHVLEGDAVARWAAAVTRLTAPGGALIVKTLAGLEAAARGAQAHTAETLRAALGESFTLEREAASTLPGPSDAPAARLFVLRRVGP